MELHKTMYMRGRKVAWQKVEGNVVVVTPETKKIHILSGAGARLWEWLESPKTTDELIQSLCGEFDVEAQRAGEDVSRFIQETEEKQITEIRP